MIPTTQGFNFLEEVYAMQESVTSGIKNRVLQRLAMSLPGGGRLRVFLHRLRGVKIGDDVWIGSEALIETAWNGIENELAWRMNR